jgi:hypothetical protein
VVLHREAGQLTEAISVLVTYLQHCSNDREAWEELADMYLEVSCYYHVMACDNFWRHLLLSWRRTCSTNTEGTWEELADMYLEVSAVSTCYGACCMLFKHSQLPCCEHICRRGWSWLTYAGGW